MFESKVLTKGIKNNNNKKFTIFSEDSDEKSSSEFDESEIDDENRVGLVNME